ncbi:hydrogenase maturation protease [Candidatus Fermentibacteria bacterium]|nr:hydrogenase maturation protease [Candidatus Fermentibacteria bacterium]
MRKMQAENHPDHGGLALPDSPSDGQEVPLRKFLSPESVVLCMGNPLRRDDGLGPALYASLDESLRKRCIDAGTTPENQVGAIARLRPDGVLLVDAVHMDLPPGSWRVLDKRDILRMGIFTTHDIPLPLFMDYLSAQVRSEIMVLAIQPGDVSFGEGLSEAVDRTVSELATHIGKSMADSS